MRWSNNYGPYLTENHALSIRNGGSAAIDLSRVASGSNAAYIEILLQPYDYAAASVIIEEAGGIIGTTDGVPITLHTGCLIFWQGREKAQTKNERCWMLKRIDKLLTGDLLKILCDMCHGDELVIADANFPADALATRLIQLPGIDGVRATEAVLSVFSLDTYSDPAFIMDLTDSDKENHMPIPVIWAHYEKAVKANGGGKLAMLERFEFYERAKKGICHHSNR